MVKLNNVIKYAWLIPAILVFGVIATLVPNAPYWDDYWAILGSIIHFDDASGIVEKISVMFSQNNENRIFPTRLVSILSYKVFGEINFFWLNLMGVFQSIIIFGVLKSFYTDRRNVRSSNEQDMIIFASACFIFNFTWFAIMAFPMAALSNIGSYSFAILALCALHRENRILVYIFTFLCVFSQGNGLVILPVVFLFYAYYKKWKPLLYWSLYFMILLGCYMYKFDPTHGMSVSLDMSQTDLIPEMNLVSQGIEFLKAVPFKVAFFFVSLGSLAGLNHAALKLPNILLIIPFLLGLISFFAYALLFYLRPAFRFSPLFLFGLFLLGSFTLIALFRGGDFEGWINSRYKFPSCLFLGTLILAYGKYASSFVLPKARVLAGVAILVACGSLIFLYPLKLQVEKMKKPPEESLSVESYASGAREILNITHERGIWESPQE